jgi:hypothetical protein
VSGFGKEQMGNFDPNAVAGFGKEQMANFDPNAVSGFGKEQMGNFDPNAVAGFGKEQMANFDPNAVAGLGKDHLKNFDAQAVSGLERGHIKEMNEGALVGFNQEHVRNLSDESKEGMGDKVSTFEKFDIEVRKELLNEQAGRLGGVGSFKDLASSVKGELSKEQLQESGWNESRDSDSLQFGSGDAAAKTDMEEGAENRAKSVFAKLKLVAD